MRYLIVVVAALVLGRNGTVGLHYYSILASRTKSEWLRLAFDSYDCTLHFSSDDRMHVSDRRGA